MKEHTDAQLVALARADDTYAFQLLIERYQPMAFYLAQRSVGEAETARELTQEAFLLAYLSLNHLRDTNRFKSWLYGIVLNVCRNWRRIHPDNTLSLDHLAGPSANILQNSFSADPQELVEERELQAQVRAAITTLTPKNQAVAYLFYFEDISMQEIASRLNISLTAVKNRLHKGRQQLQAHFQTLYPEIIADRRKKQTMLQLKFVKALQQGQNFSHYTTLILLDEQKQRVWLPRITERDQPGHTRPPVSPEQEANSAEPGTIRFLIDIIHALNGKIEKVEIDTLYEDLLYARVHLNGQHGQHTIKAHINDALQLAVHEHSPIAITEAILDRQALNLAAYGKTQQQQLEAIEDFAEHAPSRLQPRTKQRHNFDFSDGLRGWTLFTPQHDSSYVLDYQQTHTNKVSLALTLQKDRTPNSFLLAYEGFPADPYRGKRLRATAYLKAEGMQQPIFHLMVVCPFATNVDTPNNQERRSTDTKLMHIVDAREWTAHVLIIDVPENADIVSVGFSMRDEGKGTFWLDNIQLEVVDQNTPLTGTHIDPPPQHPFNLDFSNDLEFWEVKSETPWQYERDIDRSTSPYAACIRSTTASAGSSYTLQQIISAEKYWGRGKRIRLSALVKTVSAEPQASLFIGQFLSVNKIEETIKGTTEWTLYELTLAVTEGAHGLSFGIVLHGTGQVWLKSVHLQSIQSIE